MTDLTNTNSVDLQIDYGSSSISVESPYTLDTSGKLMSSNVVITSLGGSSTPNFTNIVTTTSDVSGAYVTSGSSDYYVSGIIVRSAKTLTVTNNGITNINGGNADKGVQVNGHTAIVDTYTVTSSNGDLLVPTYTASSKALSYPTTWTTAGSTATYPTLTGDVETINGLTIKDTTALKGSGTAPTDATYSYYLAKWNTASTLGTGSKVTISTSTPSGGANGDIWYQVL